MGQATNHSSSCISLQRISTINGIMEALTDAGTVIIEVYGTESSEMALLVEKVSRRRNRDDLFGKVAVVNVTRKLDLRRIQGELAHALGFTMEEKSEAKRAEILRDRIKMQQKILIILQNLNEGLDLGKLGIPSGEDHRGCKILLSCTSEEILTNRMHAQKVFVA